MGLRDPRQSILFAQSVRRRDAGRAELPERDAPNLPAKARLPRMRIGYAELTVDVSPRPTRGKHARSCGVPARGHGVTGPERANRRRSGRPSPGERGGWSMKPCWRSSIRRLRSLSFVYAMRGLSVRQRRHALEPAPGGGSTPRRRKESGRRGGDEDGQYRSSLRPSLLESGVFTDAGGHARACRSSSPTTERFRVIAVAASGGSFWNRKRADSGSRNGGLWIRHCHDCAGRDVFECRGSGDQHEPRLDQRNGLFESNLSGAKRIRNPVRTGSGGGRGGDAFQ